MADILLFGATGYTGRLTARALFDRGASFAIAGRNRGKLETLAAGLGDPEVHIADSQDERALVRALDSCKVLLTCVGPFMLHGKAAVRAALEVGVHYIDSTGEGPFIKKLIEHHHDEAVALGISLAPALGFDEVPGDLACTMAAEGLEHPQLHVTYAMPKTASAGTLRSILGIVSSKGPWIEDGKVRMVRAGEEQRWAPMAHPLGPRRAASFPLALCHLAPRHLDPSTFRTYVTTGRAEGAAMKVGVPFLTQLVKTPIRGVLEKAVDRFPEGPSDEARAIGAWTILVEARSGTRWRNIVLTGTDVYGLTAQTLAAGAVRMASDGYTGKGVLSPMEALGVQGAREELSALGVTFDTYAPVEEGA
ncbi:MAG: saccharopine dehydrogenase NADP-binding domain-containing protein [Actinobacteria bacterium]|nr:saccharopine dehydrogenase NADP-binding domain-containing protein [Actinomycetota bacterium]